MKVTAPALVLFLGAKLVLDFTSAAKGMSLKFDVAYVALLVAVSASIFFFSDDPDAAKLASIALVAAVLWGAWTYVRWFTSFGQNLAKRAGKK
jgi:hypothetical protein